MHVPANGTGGTGGRWVRRGGIPFLQSFPGVPWLWKNVPHQFACQRGREQMRRFLFTSLHGGRGVWLNQEVQDQTWLGCHSAEGLQLRQTGISVHQTQSCMAVGRGGYTIHSFIHSYFLPTPAEISLCHDSQLQPSLPCEIMPGVAVSQPKVIPSLTLHL